MTRTAGKTELLRGLGAEPKSRSRRSHGCRSNAPSGVVVITD
jgi:hypothetical protein